MSPSRSTIASPAPADASAASASRIPGLLIVLVCALVIGLSVLPPSSTRILAWPWAGFASLGWLLPIVIALYRLGSLRPASRFGGPLDFGFSLLAVTAVLSAFASPVRDAILPHLLPVLSACALPFALLPALQPNQAARTWRISGGVLVVILFASLLLWLEPWNGFHLPVERNAQPFGHANTTGSVAVLAATWLAAGATLHAGRIRLGFIGGSLLSIITAASSSSRGAVLALAVAAITAAAILLLRRGRLLTFSLLALLIAAGAIASNARLRELAFHGRWSSVSNESNQQRSAMIFGGLHLGAERPLLGWGPGSMPHVFPRVRADQPGTSDNFLHLHNTPAQLYATLGATGLLAGLLILAGLALRLCASTWTPLRIALAAGLVGSVTVLLFDHPFDTPVFALLASAHVAAWAALPPARINPRQRLATCAGAALLIPALFATGRDLPARAAYADALDQGGNPSAYADALRRAVHLAPGDPYYAHQLAAYYAVGHPFPDLAARDPAAARDLLQSTLLANPDLEYAHYNLGWLLLASDPAAAASHFLASARLAPQRGGVYFGLGLARIQQNDTPGAVRAFAAEWLLDPSSAWAPVWHRPPLDALRPAILALAVRAAEPSRINPWADLATPAITGAPFLRVRTGYGVLMGHPDGPLPVDFNTQTLVLLPPELAARVPAKPWFTGPALLDFLSAPSPRP